MLVQLLCVTLLSCTMRLQDATAEAKNEIAAKYTVYDRAMLSNDASKLLQFYSNETSENYAEEIKNRPKRTHKAILEELGGKMRGSNRILDAIAIKGHHTSIQQFRLGEGIAVVKTEEKTAVIRQQPQKSRSGLGSNSKRLNEVTLTTKMEIWYHTLNGWKLENTRVINRALVATYTKPARARSRAHS